MKALAAILLGLFVSVGYAAEPAKKTPPKKVKVQKPCKAGQTEADGCHVVKKLEKAKPKPAAKPQPKKKEVKK